MGTENEIMEIQYLLEVLTGILAGEDMWEKYEKES
jgi:hypothetical protein